MKRKIIFNLLIIFLLLLVGCQKKEQISVDIDKPKPSTVSSPNPKLKQEIIQPLYSPLPQTPEIKVAFNKTVVAFIPTLIATLLAMAQI